MDISDELNTLVQKIINEGKEFKLNTREFLYHFGYEKRTKGNRARIDNFLETNNLETEPLYYDTWIDGEIILRHKQKAKSKISKDAFVKISILPSANKQPITVTRDAKLSEAVTLMMMNNYSQLPVMSNPRSVAGFITWESIGIGISNGKQSDDVKDYLDTKFKILDSDTSLLEAIKLVIKEDVVLVQKKDKSLGGIVTIADISEHFVSMTEPFLLLERIETQIRILLDDKFLIEDVKNICCQEGDKSKIEYIDDLTFGDYIRLIQNGDNWSKLNLKIERKPFINQLDKVRQIRNDIMHFDAEGITSEQKQDLINMSEFLTKLLLHIPS